MINIMKFYNYSWGFELQEFNYIYWNQKSCTTMAHIDYLFNLSSGNDLNHVHVTPTLQRFRLIYSKVNFANGTVI